MNTYVIEAVSISGLSMIPKNLWKTKTIKDWNDLTWWDTSVQSRAGTLVSC